MDGSGYYLPSAAMAVALTVKAPALRRAWRDPLLRSVCVLIALAGLVFCFAAPPTIAQVNEWTGIANFSAPLVYCLLSAFSASCLVLMVNWRGGPPARTRRVKRWIISGYGVVIVALITLFVLGSAPAERLRDFDTYYARTPYIRELIVLYLLALTVAGVAMNVMCGRWALRVRGWLRVGLVVIVVGYLCNLAYLATKFTAVIARWRGADLDYLSSDWAPVLASAGAQISAVGFCVPLACRRAGDSWQTWATYRRLGPLWRELRPVAARSRRGVRIAWWSPAELRVTQRESDIHDGMLGLYPYFDAELRLRARDAALAAGADPEQARAEADAAMVAAAVRARAADPEGRMIDAAGAVGAAGTAGGPGTADARPASAHPAAPPASHDGPRDLVRMSLALRQSPVVAAVRGRTATRSGSEPHE